MKPGHLTLVPAGECLSIDEQASIDPAEIAPHEEEFREQQQKIQRLNEYYDDVVAELRALLDDSDEGSWIRPSIAPAPSAGE
jgi:hypothetical protein